MKEPGPSDLRAAFLGAREAGLLSEDDTVLIWFDFATFLDRLERVKKAFPAHWRHTLAIKSNPLPSLLAPAINRGFGLEAASFGELLLGARIPEVALLVWDSPVKTAGEIANCARLPTNIEILVNFDSLYEVAEFLPRLPLRCKAGLRINPMIGETGPADLSCASARSKFGESIGHRDAVIDAFAREPRLSALHVHSGSQAEDCGLLTRGVRTVLDLRREINKTRLSHDVPPVQMLDIGGGIAVDPGKELPPAMEDYAIRLLAECPETADPALRVLTEFGRYYHSSAGCVFSRVAQVKHSNGAQIIIHHAGGDLFVRETYQHDAWPHRVALLRADGAFRESLELLPSDLAGPLCFEGDYLLRDVPLPPAKPGDWLVIRDTGANSFSLWSHHCSRSFPKVLAWNSSTSHPPQIVCNRQSPEAAAQFWESVYP